MLGMVLGSGNAGVDETDPGTTLMGFVVQEGVCKSDKIGVEHVRGQVVIDGKKMKQVEVIQWPVWLRDGFKYSFPTASLVNYHKLGSLKQQELFVSYLCH